MTDSPRVVATVGGLVTESSATLGIYADGLDPAAVTALLGVAPTRVHSRGDRRGPRSPPFERGAWLLSVRGTAPLGPEEMTTELLDRLPSDAATWATLGDRYEVQLRIAIHVDGGNQGFDLSPAVMRRIAALGATVVFDIYADADGEGELDRAERAFAGLRRARRRRGRVRCSRFDVALVLVSMDASFWDRPG